MTKAAETAGNTEPWWQFPLAEISPGQWERLCDGCGKCCLYKLQDEDSDEVFYTAVACRFLDHDLIRCRCYTERVQKNPDCLMISPENIDSLYSWLPVTCAYRLRFLGKPLVDWHPLVSGNPESVIEAGQSVKYHCINEIEIDDYVDWEELVLADLL